MTEIQTSFARRRKPNFQKPTSLEELDHVYRTQEMPVIRASLFMLERDLLLLGKTRDGRYCFAYNSFSFPHQRFIVTKKGIRFDRTGKMYIEDRREFEYDIPCLQGVGGYQPQEAYDLEAKLIDAGLIVI